MIRNWKNQDERNDRIWKSNKRAEGEDKKKEKKKVDRSGTISRYALEVVSYLVLLITDSHWTPTRFSITLCILTEIFSRVPSA